MAITGNNLQQLEDFNFEKWIMENEDNIEPIKDIINLLAPIREYLPNIETFIIWLCEIEDGINNKGFFEKQYSIISHLEIVDYYNSNEIQNRFIDEFDNQLKQYHLAEKVLFIKILLTLLINTNEVNTSIYNDAKAEKEGNNFKHYSINDYWNFCNACIIFEDLITYYTLQFNKFNKDLPFKIIDKNKMIEYVGDEFENIKWYIEIPKKSKQPSTQPTPPQKRIKPIKWLKNSNLLAYLINELKTYGFIDEDSIWAICEQIFVDKKGLPIKAQTFTSMVKNYEAITMYDEKGNPTTQKGKPKTHTEITELIKTLKALSKEIE